MKDEPDIDAKMVAVLALRHVGCRLDLVLNDVFGLSMVAGFRRQTSRNGNCPPDPVTATKY